MPERAGSTDHCVVLMNEAEVARRKVFPSEDGGLLTGDAVLLGKWCFEMKIIPSSETSVTT
jgi:hypothetical protein